MLMSIAYIFIIGFFTGWICKKLHLPSLIGMILTGIIIGPYTLNLLDKSILDISSELRQIALIIILTRAGLSLDVEDLKKVGRPAFLMCFVPACLEIIGMVILAPRLLGMNTIDSLIMGSVIAAVSPAVIVPKMLKIMKEGYGTKKSIPQLILAGASVDDVFVIVMFSAFTGLAKGDSISALSFLKIPVSLITGILAGIIAGYIIIKIFKNIKIRGEVKTIILLSAAFIMVSNEDTISSMIPFSALIAVMITGIVIQRKERNQAIELSEKFNQLWIAAEVLLFVLVGASVDMSYAFAEGINAVILIFGVLIFRSIGVVISLIGTELNRRERIFCIFSYLPKATVQAAIGGVPLAMGLSCGNRVLTMAVLAILITAPLGAFLIERNYNRLLEKNR